MASRCIAGRAGLFLLGHVLSVWALNLLGTDLPARDRGSRAACLLQPLKPLSHNPCQGPACSLNLRRWIMVHLSLPLPSWLS